MATVTSNDGTRIAYQTVGEGPPVVLVGGAMNVRQSAEPMAEALAPHLTAVTYDRRGRGESSDTEPYAVEREVEDIAALVEAVGGSASVYGHSSGAILALEAAAAGVPLTRVAAFEPPYRPGITETWRRQQATLRELSSSGRRGEAVEFFMRDVIGMPPEAVAGARQAPFWPGLEAIAPTLVYDSAVTADGVPPADRLGRIEVPVLLLGSNASWPWMQDAVRAAAACLAESQVRMLDGGVHDVPPEMLAPVLVKFLAG